ncbi:MAG: HNH endonuclease [Deltaproteobacteria bacterium]|nr:HNH endonuclease [Deltaproteobacteria bacterium]
MLQAHVLVLNRSFFPVHITNVKRAFCLLYRGVARAVDEQYQTFDFHSWSELSGAVHANGDRVGLVDRLILVPRVILLTTYDRLPKREIRFSRLNILIRDNYTCQYCGGQLKKNQLNLDHVIPRSRGGKTTWENVVTSCHDCNRLKGGKLPKEAGLKLVQKPYRPKAFPFSLLMTKPNIHRAWKPFLNVVDFSYWNAELEP